MIDLQEIRVYNWVEKNGEPVKIANFNTWNHLVWFSDDFNETGTLAEELYPVALTPEILEKLGFMNKGKYQANSLDIIQCLEREDAAVHFCYEIYNPMELLDVSFYVGSDLIRSKVNTLHQLQNLYFALTDKELEYKP